MSRQTKRLFSFSEHDNAVLGYLLTPSWLSGLVAVTASTGVVLWAVLTSIHYNGSTLSGALQQLFTLHHVSNQASVVNTYQTLGNNFSTSTIISDIPLFIFWAGVGLVVYSFTMSIFSSLRNAAAMTSEMNYINADRKELIVSALEHLLIRAVVLAVWFVLIRYTLHRLLPYVIALASVGAGSADKLLAVGYIAGAIALLAVFLHVHTVMLRLLLLKPRLFWQSSYS